MRRSPWRPQGLDRIDLNILSTLLNRARISKVQMGAEVGLSARRCYQRIQGLEQAGIIRGYYADIDIARVAKCRQFLTLVTLDVSTPRCVERFEQTVLESPEIVSCQGLLGNIDYLMSIVVETAEHHQEVIARLHNACKSQLTVVSCLGSRVIKSVGESSLRQLVGRLRSDESSGSPR